MKDLERYYYLGPWNERTVYCWVLKRKAIFQDDKTIDSAHILDQIFCSPTQDYDFSNRLRLSNFLHNLYDERLIYFDLNGVLKSDVLSKEYLQSIGIPKNASLPRECLTDARVEYLKQRINDYHLYQYNKQLRLHEKREIENKHDKKR